MSDQCPICKSHLTSPTGPVDPADPRWTDDPVKTARGLAGEEYVGITPIRHYHIKQLQDYYQYSLTEAGLPEVEMFPVDDLTSPTKCHVEQLRLVIEDLLEASGLTIADYFKSNKYGETYTTSQVDWTDVDREQTGHEGEPLFPPTVVAVRAIHIEELRRGCLLGRFQTLFCSSCTYPLHMNYTETPGQGIGKTDTEHPYFNHFSRVYEDYSLQRTVNNMDECLVIQRGFAHIFSARCYLGGGSYSRYSLPMYTVVQTSDWTNQQGYNRDVWELGLDESELIANDQIAFDPPLHTGYDQGGICGLTVDDSGDDYVMYTAEYWQSGETTNLGDWMPNSIVKYIYPQRRTLGISSGISNQTFNSSSVGIYIPMIAQSEVITVDNQEWIRVDNFSSSTPSSTHYTVNYTTGVITFGDGVQGKIPPRGTTIKIWILLTKGGVWTRVGTVVPTESNSFYYGVQAKNGKLWYMKAPAIFSYLGARITHVESKLKGRHHTYTFPSPPPRPGGSYNVGETWQYYYRVYGGDQLRIFGTSTYEIQLANPGLRDSGLYLSIYPFGGATRPHAINDTPNFELLFDNPSERLYCDQGYDQVIAQYLTNYPTPQIGQTRTYYIMKLDESRYSGVWLYNWGTSTWEFHTEVPWVYSELSFSAGHDATTAYAEEDQGKVVQIGDLVRSYNGTEWDQYKEWTKSGSPTMYQATSPGSGYVWRGNYQIGFPRFHLTPTPIYYRWRVNEVSQHTGAYEDTARYYFIKSVLADEKLSDTVPTKIVIHHPEITDPLLVARGGHNWSEYDKVMEVTYREEVEVE